MIWPGETISSPNFFTPRRRPSESRPLRDEPPAFLCASVPGPNLKLRNDCQHMPAQPSALSSLAIRVLLPIRNARPVVRKDKAGIAVNSDQTETDVIFTIVKSCL